MNTTMTDMDDNEQYRLLIHSLTHEHTHANGARHLLLLQKWIRDNEEGWVNDLRQLLNYPSTIVLQLLMITCASSLGSCSVIWTLLLGYLRS